MTLGCQVPKTKSYGPTSTWLVPIPPPSHHLPPQLSWPCWNCVVIISLFNTPFYEHLYPFNEFILFKPTDNVRWWKTKKQSNTNNDMTWFFCACVFVFKRSNHVNMLNDNGNNIPLQNPFFSFTNITFKIIWINDY